MLRLVVTVPLFEMMPHCYYDSSKIQTTQVQAINKPEHKILCGSEGFLNYPALRNLSGEVLCVRCRPEEKGREM